MVSKKKKNTGRKKRNQKKQLKNKSFHPETDEQYKNWFIKVCYKEIWEKMAQNSDILSPYEITFVKDFAKKIDLIQYPTIKQIKFAYRISNKVYKAKRKKSKKNYSKFFQQVQPARTA